MNTRTIMRGADANSDHHMVMGKFRLKLCIVLCMQLKEDEEGEYHLLHH